MQNILENAANTRATPQQQGLVSTIFKAYQNRFGLFWRVMLPVIIVSLVFNSAIFLFFKVGVPEAQWTFGTSQGVSARSSSTFDSTSGTFQPSPEPTGVQSSVGFNGSSFHIGLLWLAMCPLALIIVHRHRGENTTFGEVWQQTRRKAGSILGACILMLLVAGGPFVILTLTIAGFIKFVIPDSLTGFPAPIILLMLIAGVIAVYFLVKWSLCNQAIILEDLPAVAAIRRSSELVRGRWGQFFGMYLLLTLGTMVFTTAVLSLTLMLFSVVSPEFAPIREVLQSGKFFGLFFGGRIQITLQSAPVWAIGTMVAINTLIHAVFAPIWAILTTHLYMERAGIPEQEGLG